MITLEKFEFADIPRLIAWVPDARFLLQWAGPQYHYPLDVDQLTVALEETMGSQPIHFMFKAVQVEQKTVIGHVELMAVDRDQGNARLARVLIGPQETRGRGYGKQMVNAALEFSFNKLNLNEVHLGVFDFNTPAIRCYERLGFEQHEICQDARKFGGESWTLITMRLWKQDWQRRCRPEDLRQGIA